MRQAVALAFGAAGQQHRGHGRRLSHAIGHDVRLHQVHGVENGKARGDGASRRIDIQRNVFFRIFGGQEQHLRDDQIGDVVVNGRAQENDVLLEQARIDIERAFAARGLLHNHGHEN